MSDPDFPAQCDSCAQEYRVPDADRTYRCRACGGKVQVIQVEEAPPVEASACPSCGAEVQPEDAFCGDCGEDLRAEEDPVAPRPGGVRARSRGRGRARGGRKGEERRQASHELVKAFGFLKTLRVFFRLSIGLSVLAVPSLLWLMTLNQFPFGGLMVSLMISLVATCVMIFGERLLFFRPFFWSVMFACLVTLARASDAYQNDFNLVWTVGGLIWAGMFWAFVPATARVRRLLEENPDLHISRQMLGILKRGGTPDEYAEAQEVAEAKARATSIKCSVGLSLLTAIGAGVIYAQYHRPAFPSAWEEFVSDWEQGDPGQVASWFRESQQERQRKRFESVQAHRGWGNAWPSASEVEFLYDEDDVWEYDMQVAEASYPEGEIRWSFSADGASWVLTEVELPAPPFDEIEEECVRQWNLSNIPGVAALHRDPVKMVRSMERMAAKRDWEGLPQAHGVRVQGGGDKREILLDTEEGTVLIRFGLLDDAWSLATIKPPRD